MSAFHVFEKLVSQPLSQVRPFDEAGDIRHHERESVAHFDDPEVRFKRREGIVGNARPSPRKRRQKR